jgi:hypothetical protein
VTAADATQSHLIVIERSLGILAGWRCHISIVPLAVVEPGTATAIIPVKRFTIPREFPIDNMEAVTARNMGDDTLELILVSDDNFTKLQRTLLLQIELDLADLRASIDDTFVR